MNLLFTLCGRAGSKGFKNKNLKNFLEIPLVYYSLAAIELFIDESTQKNYHIDTVLNTDSKELIQLSEQQNIVELSVIRRNTFLGGDTIPKVSVIKDCLTQMEEQNQIQYDVVIDLDLTSPLRTTADIQRALEEKIKRTDVDVVYSVTESRRNPYFNMVKQENGYFCKAIPSEYTARQQAPLFYDMNASIYVYSTYALKNKQDNIFFNSNCDAIVMKDTGILDIDSEQDFELLQVIAQYFFKTEQGLGRLYHHAKQIAESAC